jgi:hypothetical protein
MSCLFRNEMKAEENTKLLGFFKLKFLKREADIVPRKLHEKKKKY